MATIRKREWAAADGQKKAAWQVKYVDSEGNRRSKQFSRKKEAEAWLVSTNWQVKQGTHTADTQSITVEQAANLWLTRGERETLETATLKGYEQHVRLHIAPSIGKRRLNQLTRPAVEEFRDSLLDRDLSRPMARKVLRSLGSIIREAERLGYVATNVCTGVTVRQSGREKAKVVPPTKQQLRLLLTAAQSRRPMDYPMLLVLLFAGLRASELRALAWSNVDLRTGSMTIDRRADLQNVIGPPKSASGHRSIPIPSLVVTELRKWKLRCPPSELDLVFPSTAGTPIFHANLVLGFQEPVQVAAGVCRQRVMNGKLVFDRAGAPVLEGLYSLHSFRHAAASLWIEQRVDAKRVQTWMGHHSIQVTFDTYGHLFAAVDHDRGLMLGLERAVFGEIDATQKQHGS